MYLRRITLQGFKSFAKKTVLEFGPGITAIVGPNGTGKSNISDAIKWVLGEQSMKNLRSKKSEDVIFSGSGKKSKSSMAEVSLDLDNRDKIVPIEYTELNITRRVFRSGEGEYFLNGAKTRLLDITEILSKSGFGRSTYTVIGQGTVDKLITQTPEERRELFKDASGVKHYYFKKEQALKKFEESRKNLVRVSDIIREIKPRLDSLEKQQKDAHKRKILIEEIREFQKKYFGSELKDIKEKLDEYEKRYQEISQEIEKIEGEILELTKKLEIRASGKDKEIELEKEKEIFNLEQKIQNLQDNLMEIIKNDALIVEKQNFYKKNLSFLKNDLAKTQDEIKEKEKEIKEIENNNKELEKELENLSLFLNSLSDKYKDKILEPKEVILKIKKSLEEIYKKVDSLISNPQKIKEEIRAIIEFLCEQESFDLNNLELKKSEILQKIEKIKLEISLNKEKQANILEILSIYRNKEKELLQKIKKAYDLKKITSFNSKKAAIEEEIKKLREEKEEQRKILEDIRAKNRLKEGEFFEIEKNYRIKRDVLADFKEELTKIEIEMARLKTKKEDLETKVKENFKSIEELEFISLSQEEKNAILENISQLRNKLGTLGGAIDINNIDDKEYNEVKKRYEFLVSQSEDLKKAISSAKKVVLELEKKINYQFKDRFEKISQKFNYYFQKLFGGGTAKLILEEIENERDNENETIIDIQAIPPGKKVHTLNTLSGGEKALTSIALLFAIFSVNPSPFCVLDEVDAALDESNSFRFANLLSELAVKTQFIVVTHNRETMKKAKVLYGVTMDEAKVSKILSLNLEEAEKYSE